jgi:hypothetical protein
MLGFFRSSGMPKGVLLCSVCVKEAAAQGMNANLLVK